MATPPADAAAVRSLRRDSSRLGGSLEFRLDMWLPPYQFAVLVAGVPGLSV
jgi:hypothetical protein